MFLKVVHKMTATDDDSIFSCNLLFSVTCFQISSYGCCHEAPKINTTECKDVNESELHLNTTRTPIQSIKYSSYDMKMSVQTESGIIQSTEQNSKDWKFIACFLDKLCFCCFAAIELILFFLTCFKNF